MGRHWEKEKRKERESVKNAGCTVSLERKKKRAEMAASTMKRKLPLLPL